MILGRNSENAYKGPFAPINMSTARDGNQNSNQNAGPRMPFLTSIPSLPVGEALVDILPAQRLAGRRELIVSLETLNDECALVLVQKLGIIWEVLDEIERCCSGKDSQESFQNEYPRPDLVNSLST